MRKTSKIKRIFAGLLALLLTVALLPAQTARIAKADDPAPTINTSKDVSLTIFKYRYDGNNPGTATGTIADRTGVPPEAQLLNGVTFDVYKVADIVQVNGALKYATVSNVKSALETVHSGSDYTYIDGGLDSNEIKSLFTTVVLTQISSAKISKKTQNTTVSGAPTDGVAQFSNAELDGQGLYLVVESAAPAVVTTMADPFLVSLPMTDVTNKNDWIYDVYVFPKNGTTTGGIKLIKQGKIGGGTATAIDGAKFKLQKKQSDNTWLDLTKDDNGNDIGNAGVITVPNTGITISGLSQGTYRFVETEVPSNTGYILDTVTTYEFVVSIADAPGTDESDSHHPYDVGDLLITYGGKTYLSKSSIIPEYTVTNYKPDVEKKVLKRDGDKATAADWVDAVDYSVGDKIPYCIQIDVPQNVASLRSFEITDTLVNQNYDSGSLKIYSDAALSNDITTTLGVTVDTSGGTNTWKIEFNSFDVATGSKSTTGTTSKLAGYAGSSIYIYFTATLTSDAVVTSVGNKNKVDLNYSNEIVPAKDSTDNEVPAPPKDIIHDEAIVYTFEIEVVKKDGKTNTALTGVEFDLYREINTGETVDPSAKLSVDEATKLGLPTSTTGYVKVNLTTLSTDANGKINVHGLENGTYYLVETKALEGYNLLKEPVEVEISASYAIISTETTTTDSGTGITTTKTEVSTNQYNNTGTNGVIATEILNNKGFTLPTTGGIGSAIFVFVGVSMMVAAVILFFVSRKKENEKTKP